jgi:hypothetical protein
MEKSHTEHILGAGVDVTPYLAIVLMITDGHIFHLVYEKKTKLTLDR